MSTELVPATTNSPSGIEDKMTVEKIKRYAEYYELSDFVIPTLGAVAGVTVGIAVSIFSVPVGVAIGALIASGSFFYTFYTEFYHYYAFHVRDSLPSNLLTSEKDRIMKEAPLLSAAALSPFASKRISLGEPFYCTPDLNSPDTMYLMPPARISPAKGTHLVEQTLVFKPFRAARIETKYMPTPLTMWSDSMAATKQLHADKAKSLTK